MSMINLDDLREFANNSGYLGFAKVNELLDALEQAKEIIESDAKYPFKDGWATHKYKAWLSKYFPTKDNK